MALTDTDFAFVADLVRDQAAIVLAEGKQYLVESRLTPLARRRGLPDVAALVRLLRQQPPGDLHASVVDAMTTNETSFFRDGHPFEALRRDVIPDLVRRRAADRALNVWCAAASTGQEPYTVAMLLREHFRELADWNVRIIASDLSAEVLGRAVTGRYSELEVARGLPPHLLARHFERDGAGWRINDDIRAMVEFRLINLVKPWPVVPRIDVLLMRNVLIYFDLPTKREVLRRARDVLRPDGYLFLGTAENTMVLEGAFRRQESRGSQCYRPEPGWKATA